MEVVYQVRAGACVSVSDLKKNPSAVMAAAGGQAVAILNHNRPVAYVVPVDEYERMLDELDDAALARLAKQRMSEPTIKVTLDELRAEIQRDIAEGMAETGRVNQAAISNGSRKAPTKSSGAKRKAA